MEDEQKTPGDWEYSERPLLFELRMPIDGTDKCFVVLRTPDENAARVAFDAGRKILTQLAPRPKAALELYLGPTTLDVFEQTKEGEEFEPAS
jgi:hypothetical protein